MISLKNVQETLKKSNCIKTLNVFRLCRIFLHSLYLYDLDLPGFQLFSLDMNSRNVLY